MEVNMNRYSKLLLTIIAATCVASTTQAQMNFNYTDYTTNNANDGQKPTITFTDVTGYFWGKGVNCYNTLYNFVNNCFPKPEFSLGNIEKTIGTLDTQSKNILQYQKTQETLFNDNRARLNKANREQENLFNTNSNQKGIDWKGIAKKGYSFFTGTKPTPSKPLQDIIGSDKNKQLTSLINQYTKDEMVHTSHIGLGQVLSSGTKAIKRHIINGIRPEIGPLQNTEEYLEYGTGEVLTAFEKSKINFHNASPEARAYVEKFVNLQRSLFENLKNHLLNHTPKESLSECRAIPKVPDTTLWGKVKNFVSSHYYGDQEQKCYKQIYDYVNDQQKDLLKLSPDQFKMMQDNIKQSDWANFITIASMAVAVGISFTVVYKLWTNGYTKTLMGLIVIAGIGIGWLALR